MSNESNLTRLGWLVSGFDARNSSITGTTLSGPSGSGQFLAVVMSTVANTISLSTLAGVGGVIGILQNKPSTGIAADIGIFGVSKAVAGATITPGQELMSSSTAAGTLIPVTTGLRPVGRALGGAVVGDIFSAAIYGFGNAGAAA